jgi:hypothetical protein
MLDFKRLQDKSISLNDLVANLNRTDLADLTHEMIDQINVLISDCIDNDVIFQPLDPFANDPYASNQEEVGIAWTLGHVIVHITASSEESAFLAAEMARGVPNHGRSRSEVSWQKVTTMQQCRQRLEESRRMRLSSLELWPDQPDLSYRYETWPGGPQVNAIGRFVLGLLHDDAHLGQITEIVSQSKLL